MSMGKISIRARLVALFVVLSFSGGCLSRDPKSRSSTKVSNQETRADASLYNMSAPIVPDPNLTPGDTLDVTKDDICTSGYSRKVRDVPQSVKEKVYSLYGISGRQPGEYEVDHLISLELGGSNSIKNLWPESYKTKPWNAYEKDKVENKLHKMICNGQIELKDAQREIATDWMAAFDKYIGNKSTPGADADDEQTGPVVGNKRSHIYHRPGCPDYDRVAKKNRVEFKDAAEAEVAGYTLAGNCD